MNVLAYRQTPNIGYDDQRREYNLAFEQAMNGEGPLFDLLAPSAVAWENEQEVAILKAVAKALQCPHSAEDFRRIIVKAVAIEADKLAHHIAYERASKELRERVLA